MGIKNCTKKQKVICQDCLEMIYCHKREVGSSPDGSFGIVVERVEN